MLRRIHSAGPAGFILGFIVLMVICGPWISHWDFESIDFDGVWSAPPGLAGGHWFGTDELGRDLFVRVCVGGRISLLVGLVSTLVSLLIGVSYGSIAGFAGGRLDGFMMRTVDVLYALPFMFFVVLLTVFFGRQFWLMFVAIGAVNWLDMARIVRGQTLSLRRREFVEAARVSGAPTSRILYRHIVPNLLGVVIAYATLTVPQVILIESFLSFLGLGIQEPATSWGALVSDGAHAMQMAPWALLFPAGFLAATLLCLNALGERSAGRMILVKSKHGVVDAVPLPSTATQALLQVRGLQVRFPTATGELRAVDGLSFELAAGETLGIVGESGSGKTQGAMSLIGLQGRGAQVTGSVCFEGRELLGLPSRALNGIRGARIGLVPQDPMTSLNPYRRIGDQMSEVLIAHRGVSGAAAWAECVRMLDAVRIRDAASRVHLYPHEFSGGMRQRALIAMALLCRPPLLIADEPTTALDVTVQAEILALLSDLQREFGMALILITHDLDVVARACSRLLVMYAGRAVETGPTAALMRAPRHPYTAGLLGSRARVDAPAGTALLPIPGQPPDLARLPSGCAFNPRCAFAMAICREQLPALLPESGGQRSACHLAGNQEITLLRA